MATHPWRELRELDQVSVHLVDLQPGIWGATDGHRHIWIDRGLTQTERRCTLAHELEHLRRGHDACQEPATEADVMQEAARRLIPFEALLAACRWATSVHELADELWVDEDTIRTRLEHLHPSERTKLREVLADDHPGLRGGAGDS